MSLSFPLQPNPLPASDARVAEVLAHPGFGTYFTDHMAVATWTKGQGWQDDSIKPYGPFSMDPASAVFHYAQEIFEGMKAYRHADGSVWLFRPEKNAERFVHSAARLMLPELPVEDFLTACRELVKADVRWVPNPEGGEQSLYLRPFMMAFENFLGVRAAERALFCVIASPVGTYFAEGVRPINIWMTDEYSRAGQGGTGSAKCGGNYASSLIAQYEGYQQGCSQVLFIQPAGEHDVEELGGMNVFAVSEGGALVTPALDGTILHGVTRDSIITVARSLGLAVEERPLGASELRDGITSGEFVEAFCCGTAAVISPIGAFKSKAGEYALPPGSGAITMQIREAITDIQFGRAEDTFGWMHRVC
ncbi:branched-chain amino acid aminotransferase [Propioniciclava tarda]|uniref:Branched-chain-amino-acid aminotransferase n=1 Tax=Propioniciclava tarda TaxID=433330 RepID=A0A4V2JT20_PROTD|nr:branched-chain amino acid aminotransferase [Propioniciclava tarda]TBT94571.1 branched-chain amino acid aminotransferase [Propioniciclava tarda]SMO68369.1 branched chain amino acid aminotransferase apoenzyme [Propioniciclava tarda]HOA87885.1 branched-chain amino acid aminotransferase [Propioniciclava tarda]HQA30027.1 branched-chain amino acid aminotransferase [Propioniciclava tarda]HQD59663.1 branched-chain amino acid aminotransferase [Propioniciclava tarda]